MGNTSSQEEVNLGKVIGSGAFAQVHKAQWNGRTVAAKKLRGYLLQKTDVLKKFEGEWQILRDLNHPNIVQYFTVILPKKEGESAIIITELLDCDLRTLIEQTRQLGNGKRRTLPFSATVRIMMDVASGLEYLHAKNIVHRDISSKNILLDSDRRAKIADLGLAKLFPQGNMQASADPGCLACRAPETFGDTPWRKVDYGPGVDVFSFGTVLLEAIIGHGPQQLSEVKTQDGEIVPEHVRRSADIFEMGTEHPLRDLVLVCLSDVPEERPRASLVLLELREHNQEIDVMRSRDKLTGIQIHRVNSDHFDYSFKVMLLGSPSVGKTSIILRFADPASKLTQHPTTPTVGEHFQRLQMKGKSILLQLTDTMGETTRMRSLTPQMYRGTTGVVLVFDVSDWSSLVEVRQWIGLVRKHCDDVPLVLVGNKGDKSDERQVDIQTAEEFAEEHGILMYFEVSAKTGENIDETFSALIETLIERDKGRSGQAEHARGSARRLRGGKLPIPASITDRRSVRPTVVYKDPGSIVLNGDPPQDRNTQSGRSCPC